MYSMIREDLLRTCFTVFLDMHPHSAINTKSLARDITRVRQTEKADGSCEFIGSTKASHWGVVEHEFALLLCDNRGELRRHKAWSDCIGGDIATGHFAGCTQSQGDDS